MSAFRNERMLSAIGTAAAEFVNLVSNGRSFITVTRVEYREDSRTINIFVSVMPSTEAGPAMHFLERQRADFSEFLKKRIQTRALPSTVFMPDPAMSAPPQPGIDERKGA